MDINFVRAGLLNIGLRADEASHTMERHSNKSLFLDRDGVIIKECNYLHEACKVKLEHGIRDLIKAAKEKGFLVFVVTNQSGIERGYFGWDEYETVSIEMCNQLGKAYMVDGIIAWGGASESEFRKPNGKMLKIIECLFNVDMTRSILIGDKLTDILAGKACNIGMLVQVAAGHGKTEIRKYTNKRENLIHGTSMLYHEDTDTSAVFVRDLSNFAKVISESLLHKMY